MTGPNARASAPSERKMPIIVPFCWTVPNAETIAISSVGTKAAASNRNNVIIILQHLGNVATGNYITL